MNPHFTNFISFFTASLSDGSFVKCTLSSHLGPDPTLKNIYIEKILVKREEKLSLTFRHKTRDIIKNYTIIEGISFIEKILLSDFRAATLFTTKFDLQYENIGGRKSFLKQHKATHTSPPSLQHDRVKNRPLSSHDKIYLQKLGIADSTGAIYKNAQDKFRQINAYISLLKPLLKDLGRSDKLKIADMGSGKGYLTFALADYLASQNWPAEITGIEYRADLVSLCNTIAKESGFSDLSFYEGAISDYDITGNDILIALHACDTATDDAIAKGILASSSLIVVAPCCHKQIRREMEKRKTFNEFEFLLRHGIFMERQAEMVTDAIRAMILEYFGYHVKIIEFISDAHTPKNVLITAQKKESSSRPEKTLQAIKAAKARFGIDNHYLETITGLTRSD